MAALALAAVLSMPTANTAPPVAVPKTAASQTGVQPSAYTGRYYDPTQEPYRMCVAQREGRGQYWGTGSNGMYLGTYQMTIPLARGAVWMMGRELKATHGKKRGREIRRQLHATKPTLWHRHYWDMAFYTILNWEHRGSGAHHWAGGRFHCQLDMSHYGGAR
jgi:hypothetical protein